MTSPETRRNSRLPSIVQDGQIIIAAMAGTVLVPLYSLARIPDPLAGTIFGGFGRSGLIPMVLGGLLGSIFLAALRRTPRQRQRTLSFAAGIGVGSMPFVFYCATMPWWTNPAPLFALAMNGLLAGMVLGAIAWWYVPYSTVVRAKDWRG